MIVSRDGWVKRQKEVKDLATTRLREGDAVLAALAGSTRDRRSSSSPTSASPTRAGIIDVPASTGYGEPMQRLFKFNDGERVVAAFSLDPRAIGDIGGRLGATTSRRRADADARAAGARAGRDQRRLQPAVRAGQSFVEPSTRAGRRYARPADGAEVVGVERRDRRRDRDRRDARGPRHAVPGRARSTSCPARARASSSSSSTPTTTACSGSSRRTATAIC